MTVAHPLHLAGEEERPHPIYRMRAYPQSWYLVGRSADIPINGVRPARFIGHDIVLFRTATGKLYALDAHCPHMGSHLGGGKVIGECVQCPMHHWRFTGTGHCGGAQMQRAWPLAEVLGTIFVFNGILPLFSPPAFDLTPDENLRTARGKNVTITCPWYAITANAFDMQHLSTVHERALRDEPKIERLTDFRLRLSYVLRVTGKTLADRVIKKLSNDHVHVAMTCWGGTLFTVESILGKHRSMLLFGLMPTPSGVEVTPIIVMKKSKVKPVDRLRISLARWLFTRFLEKDLVSLNSMKFAKPPAGVKVDEPMRAYFEFLESLPTTAGGFEN